MPRAVQFDDDDDDFQTLTPIFYSTQTTLRNKSVRNNRNSNSQSKRRKQLPETHPGKENELFRSDKLSYSPELEIRLDSDDNCALSFVDSSLVYPSPVRKLDDDNLSLVESSLDFNASTCVKKVVHQRQSVKCEDNVVENCSVDFEEARLDSEKYKQSYLCNSIESRILNARNNCVVGVGSQSTAGEEEFEPGTQLNGLLELCCSEDQLQSNVWVASKLNQYAGDDVNVDDLVCCPLCGCDLSELNEEMRLVHTNECLDKMENENACLQPECDKDDEVISGSGSLENNHQEKVDVSPVIDWLHNLGLHKYTEGFVQEEIDWDTLQWLTEEDLFSIGVTAMGPRKKILHALHELRRGAPHSRDAQQNNNTPSCLGKQRVNNALVDNVQSSVASTDEADKLNSNKLITDYFPAPNLHRSLNITSSGGLPVPEKNSLKQVTRNASTSAFKKCDAVKNNKKSGKLKDAPQWCCIPGTPFRVDAFRYLRSDCSHWFLTHFHLDHYQGLTKSFCHGKIYCSSVTAKLINLKIGIPLEKISILPLNQMIIIDGINVTCFDANHCPGSIIILFKPPNEKVVLHTGDFRFNVGMINLSALLSNPIHTLILDTTYCDPQFDFPKQEAVIQFVMEAIQAEDFNPKTLFLIGSYTIGKERLFLEVARTLRKKVYVNAAKLCLLQCLGLKDEDLSWFTTNEYESQIHVVPMWTLASTKRLKQISSQYMRRFNLIVAFSPTGWTFGKGKNNNHGKKWKQGTLIRYEVPYSEHSSFTELKEFVKLISPTNIIPSVNNDGPESAAQMISLLS